MGIEICVPSGEAGNNRLMLINDGGSAVRPAGGKYGIATEVSTITSVPRSQKGFGYSKTWYRETGTSSYVKGNSNSQNTAVFGLEINPYSSTTPITQFYESRMNIGKLTYGGHIDLTGTLSLQGEWAEGYKNQGFEFGINLQSLTIDVSRSSGVAVGDVYYNRVTEYSFEVWQAALLVVVAATNGASTWLAPALAF